MNKNDKQILDMLEKELKNEVEKVNVPLRLQKESIVKMLENAEKDFSDKTGSAANSGGEAKIAAFTNEKTIDYTPASDGTAVMSKSKNSSVMFRKLMAIAAMLMIVVTGSIVMMPPMDKNVKAFTADSFNEGFKSKPAVLDPNNQNIIKRAYNEIIKNNIETTEKQQESDYVPMTSPEKVPDENIIVSEVTNPSSVTAPVAEQTTGIPATVIGSYSEYIEGIGGELISGNESGESISAVIPAEPERAATYGEFTADFVKVDKEYIYITSCGRNTETGAIIEQVRIVKTIGKNIEDVSTIVLSESADNNAFDSVIALYVKDGHLIAIMDRQTQSSGNPGDCTISTVAVYYDVTNPYAPVKTREHVQEGNYISSSYYESKLCLVTEVPLSADAAAGEEIVTPVFSVDGENVNLDQQNDVRIVANDAKASYLFITVTDTADSASAVGKFALLGGGSKIYCSSSAVVALRDFISVEEDENGERSTLTEAHRLNINGTDISYSGYYRLKGLLVGGISIDDESENLRALTSDGVTNRFYVIDKNMVLVKGLEIYNGNKLTSVNYSGDNCYVVIEVEEGEKTVIIDLSDSSSPKLAGTIPGRPFEDGIYELSDTMILEIKEPRTEIIKEENGEDSVIIPTTLTLYDVSDPEKPKILSEYPLDRNIALVEPFDSRCIVINEDKNIFGIPVLRDKEDDGSRSSEYILFDISGGNLELIKTCVHASSYISDAASRGTFVGDVFYTVSGWNVVAFDISTAAPEDNRLTEFPLN